MSRQDAIDLAQAYFDDGRFLTDLRRRVAIRTESQLREEREEDLEAYIREITDTPSPLATPASASTIRARRADRSSSAPGWRIHRFPPSSPTATETLSEGLRRPGATGCRHGKSRSKATGSTAAARRTTRASTASTSRPSPRRGARRQARFQLDRSHRDRGGDRLPGLHEFARQQKDLWRRMC